MLFIIGWITSRNNDNSTFFTANRNTPWYLVAFGMIGTSISGVTFISIPGQVGKISFGYFQVVLGYVIGYLVIIKFLLPLYYRLNLTSIYTYLEQRFGRNSYKTGALFFLVSRSLGSAVRLLLAATVFQVFLFDAWGVPFWLSIVISMTLIVLYSIRGGIKTIIWTDNLQTLFLVAALIMSVVFITGYLDWDTGQAFSRIASGPYSRIFFTDDPNSNQFFWKQFLGGMFITIGMTGLDQDLMQKNLTCRSLSDARKNMAYFTGILVIVNLLFLGMGALLYEYAAKFGIDIPEQTDQLFPTVALNYMPISFSLVFLLGLTAATFASTDSALTALTTSFCVDFLNFEKKALSGKRLVGQRYAIHIAFSLLISLIAIVLHSLNRKDIIDILMKFAGYTYGPLIALFSVGLFTKWNLRDKWVPLACIAAPLLMFGIEQYMSLFFPKYKFGYEVILINSILSLLCLMLLKRRKNMWINSPGKAASVY